MPLFLLARESATREELLQQLEGAADELGRVSLATVRELARALKDRPPGPLDLLVVAGAVAGRPLRRLRRLLHRHPQLGVFALTTPGTALARLAPGVLAVAEPCALPHAVRAFQGARKLAMSAGNGAEFAPAVADLADRLFVGMFRTTPEGRLLMANRVMLDMMGYRNLEEAVQVPIAQMYSEPERRSALMAQIARDGSVRNFAIELQRKDGSRFWGSVSAALGHLPSGQPMLEGVVLDHTEHRLVQRAYLQEKETSRALLNAPQQSALLFDLEGHLLEVSDEVVRRLGKPRRELIGRHHQEILPSDELDFRLRMADRAVRKDGPVRFESSQGGVLYSTVLYPVKQPDGSISGLAIFARDLTKEQQLERTIRESESRLEALIAHSSDIITIVDQDTTIRFVSPGVLPMLGFPPEELQGQRALELVHPEDRERAGERFQRLARGQVSGRPQQVEFRFRHREKGYIWLEGVGENHMETAGIRGIVLNLRDITERKRHAEELKASEERFREVVTRSNDGIYILAGSGFRFVNHRFEEMFGFEPGTLEGQPFDFMELIAPESRPALQQRSRELDQGREVPNRYDFVARRMDGTTFDAEVSVVYIGDESHRMTLGIVRDVTERREAERARAWLLQSLDAIPVGALLADTRGRLQWVNSRFRTLTGHSEEQLSGGLAFDHFELTEEAAPRTAADWRRTIRTLRQGWTGRVELRTADGRTLPAIVEISPINDEGGHVLGYVGAVVDEEKIVSLEEEKGRLESELSRQFHLSQVGLLASGFAHNIKTPLSAVQFMVHNGRHWLSLLAGDDGPEAEGAQRIEALEKLRQSLEGVGDQAKSIDQIVEEMLQYHRMNADSDRTVVELNEVLRSDAAVLRADLDMKHNVALTLDLTESRVPVRARASDIGQVFLNLLANARDAVLDQSVREIQVTSGVDEEAGVGWFQVVDSGPGFSKEVLRQLGKPFLTTKKGDDRWRRRGSGTGLGMYMVRRLLNNIGGEIEVDSRPGRTAIRIQLPLADLLEAVPREGENPGG